MVFNLLKANNGNKIEAFNELEDIYDSMSRKNRTEIARKIIELSFRHSALIDICVRNGKGKLGNYLWFLLFLNLLPYKNNDSFGNTWGFNPYFLANDILRVSFDYRNYEMAKKSITGGASFQSILLQSDSSQIENIGIAIYQMHRYYSGKSRVCSYLNLIHF